MLSGSARRELIVSRVWIQASVLVMLFGFGVMGILAYGANDGAPPVPKRIVDSAGAALFTALEDFRHPDRVVLGGTDAMASEMVAGLYRDLNPEPPIIQTDIRTAEMIKYAS